MKKSNYITTNGKGTALLSLQCNVQIPKTSLSLSYFLSNQTTSLFSFICKEIKWINLNEERTKSLNIPPINYKQFIRGQRIQCMVSDKGCLPCIVNSLAISIPEKKSAAHL